MKAISNNRVASIGYNRVGHPLGPIFSLGENFNRHRRARVSRAVRPSSAARPRVAADTQKIMCHLPLFGLDIPFSEMQLV